MVLHAGNRVGLRSICAGLSLQRAGATGGVRVDSGLRQRDKGAMRGPDWHRKWGIMQGFPIAVRGMTVGLLGGSFDPAHDGHAHLTREALKRFGLQRVWWLVSPGNPLKANPPAPMADRITRAQAVMGDPRVVITDIEARLGTRYTAETLRRLKTIYPGVRFVWLMGADNLAQFDRWQQWEWIVHNVPIGVIARPGYRLAARGSRAVEEYARYRIAPEYSQMLPRVAPPAWCFLHVPMMKQSSSAIRARGEWGKRPGAA